MFLDYSAQSGKYVEVENINTLETINGTRGNNERLMPSGRELGDKEFYIGLWTYLQTNSKSNQTDGYRYIEKSLLSPTKIVEFITNTSKTKDGTYVNKPITRPTVTKGIDLLIKRGYIMDVVDGELIMGDLSGKEYYRIQNDDVFQYYVLLENEFLKTLLSTLSQDAIKVYLIYYSFNYVDTVNPCYLTQEEILKRIGLKKSGQSLEKLRHINTILRTCGLIEQDYMITKENGVEIKRNLITKAPLYWNTKLYEEAQRALNMKKMMINRSKICSLY